MAKQSKLVGLEIQEIKHLGGGITMIIFTDGSFIVVSQLSDKIEGSELGLEAAESDDDEEEDSEEEDEDDSDDEEEEEEEDEDEEEDEEEDDEDSEELTAEDLLEMDSEDLEDLIDDEELDVDADDFEDDEEGLRKAVAKVLGLKLPAKKKGKK